MREAAFHRSLSAATRGSPTAQVDELFAGRERAEEPWAEPLALAREVAAALRAARARDSLEVEIVRAEFEFDSDGHVTRRALRASRPSRTG